VGKQAPIYMPDHLTKVGFLDLIEPFDLTLQWQKRYAGYWNWVECYGFDIKAIKKNVNKLPYAKSINWTREKPKLAKFIKYLKGIERIIELSNGH